MWIKQAISICALFILAGCAVTLQPERDMFVQQSRYGELELHMTKAIADIKTAPFSDLFYLCFAYSKIKRYDRLFPCLDELQVKIDSGDFHLYWFDFSSSAVLMRAEAAIELGDFEDAIRYARTAEELTASPDAYKQMRIFALSANALVYALTGDRATAEKFIAKLEDITFGFSDDLLATDKYIGLAKVYLALGDYQKALDAISRDSESQGFKALADFITGASLSGTSLFTYWELPKQLMQNRALLETGNMEKARDGYDSMLQFPQMRDNGALYWLALYDRGRISVIQDDADTAIEYFSKAVEVIEQQRSTINTEANKIGFVGDKQAVYSALIDTLFKLERYDRAFEYMERAKARALVDLLAERTSFAAKEVTLEAAEAMIADLSSSEADSVVQSNGGLSLTGTRSADAIEILHDSAPELASLVSVQSPDAQTIVQRLGSKDGLLEYYQNGDGPLYVIVVKAGIIKGYRLDAQGLEDDVLAFRRALKQPNSEDWRVIAVRLHDRLIGPVKSMLQGLSGLTIVPHGILHYLPFNALYDGQAYLVDRFAIRLLPSANVLAFLKPSRKGKLLGLGNPDLDDRRYDLPGAEAETREIAQFSANPTIALRKQASETLIKQARGQYAIIHIASHGTFNAEDPLQSRMLLAADQLNDGNLFADELYDLHLDADLVTLSACETGLGKVSNGDDVVGLVRGFFYAGANAVVASLWLVDDAATRYLMVEFYKALQSSDKRTALRKAQLSTRKRYPHPVYWSAFQLFGSD